MKKRTMLVLLINCLLIVGMAMAQVKDEKTATPNNVSTEIKNKYYRLDYVLRELDGSKEINKRTYTVMVRTDGHRRSLRTGTRVPAATTVGTGGATSTQYQYIDVGVNIDTDAFENSNGLSLDVTAELSSIADSEAMTHPGGPMVRQWRGSGNVALTPGKSSIVFSGDESTTNHKFELSVTATPVR